MKLVRATTPTLLYRNCHYMGRSRIVPLMDRTFIQVEIVLNSVVCHCSDHVSSLFSAANPDSVATYLKTSILAPMIHPFLHSFNCMTPIHQKSWRKAYRRSQKSDSCFLSMINVLFGIQTNQTCMHVAILGLSPACKFGSTHKYGKAGHVQSHGLA